MQPQVGKEYLFVRAAGDLVEQAVYARYADGSAYVVAGAGEDSIWEGSPDAWQLAIAHLRSRGFLVPAEAKAAGFLPADWEPT